MGSLDRLQGKRVYLDANIVTYILERPAAYEAIMSEFMAGLVEHRFSCITAELTATEVLTGAAKAGDSAAVERCLEFFESGDIVELVRTKRIAFFQAGLLRAKSPVTTPDAIHLMTACNYGAHIFLTNDKRLRPMDDIDLVQLPEIRSGP
jgi:predicted nucleic acid-binding protein